MEVIDVNNIKLDIGQIQYSKPINVNDFLTFYKVNYGENFFILKTPEMYINSEPNLIFKSPFIHVSFRGKKTNKKLDTFYNWIMEVENKIYEDVKKVYKDSIFLPSIIDYTNKIDDCEHSYESMKLYISKDIDIYDRNTKKSVFINDNKEVFKSVFYKGCNLKMLVKLEHIWTNNLNFGCCWKIIQCLTDIEQKEPLVEDEQNNLENDKISNNLEKNDIIHLENNDIIDLEKNDITDLENDEIIDLNEVEIKI